MIRRTYGFTEKDEKVTFGDVEVDLTSRSVKKGNKTINLSLKEFDLLAYLCRNKGTAIHKDRLLSEVWGAFR